jgi:DNA-binding NarL/FixJ family response regulator
MKILIVDDHVLFREGLVSLLSNYPDFTIVGECGSVSDAIEKALRFDPEIILLDFSMPDGSGIDAITEILTHRPEIKIIVLTIYESEDLLLAAIRNGAVGYLLKNIPISKLILTLRGLANGEAALSRMMTARIIEDYQRIGKTQQFDKNNMNGLTMRELEVLRLLGGGLTNQVMAEHLGLAENTVKVHVHNILEKLNLKNRHEAAQYSRRFDFELFQSTSINRNQIVEKSIPGNK